MARGSGMQIEKIYIYPIKSFRGVEVDSATLTQQGFPYDRTFALLKLVENKETGQKQWDNMAVSTYNEMVRFIPAIHTPTDGQNATMTITHHPIDNSEAKSITMPLEPDISDLEEVEITMHMSPTKAYKMGDEVNSWLSARFGYECILIYINDNLREVRMSNDPNHNSGQHLTSAKPNWWSSLTSKATEFLLSTQPAEISTIRFADVAPYLIVSSKSMEDVDPRLSTGENFDITKFRPNIVVSGAEEAWEEDFWAELTLSSSSGEETAKLALEHNCGRCRSINIDYETGAQGTGEAGTMLKKLMKDRRVDAGTKWSPVFGRYAFLPRGSEGTVVRVGQEVVVSRVNAERTAFDWEGLSTLPGGGRD